MPVLQNNFHSNLFLPDGTAIRRGGPDVVMPADKWAKEMKNPVVAAWVENGWIVVEGDIVALMQEAEPVRKAADPVFVTDPAPVSGGDETVTDSSGSAFEDLGVEAPDTVIDALRIAAESAGIKVDNRWGEKRLREEIDKASAE